jgi:hypothetical protein
MAVRLSITIFKDCLACASAIIFPCLSYLNNPELVNNDWDHTIGYLIALISTVLSTKEVLVNPVYLSLLILAVMKLLISEVMTVSNLVSMASASVATLELSLFVF